MTYYAHIEALIDFPLCVEADNDEDVVAELKAWYADNRDKVPWSPDLKEPQIEVRFSAHPSEFRDRRPNATDPEPGETKLTIL